jgi:dienelactone hydrolase
MLRKLIGKAALAMAVAGALATVAAASPPPGRTPAPPVTQVSVQDVRVPVPGQQPVPAYLVRSAGALEPGSQAGILFLHWLGQIHSDRTEFLAEAIQLAPRGAVSLLPQGVFPWRAAPSGKPADVTAIKQQLAVFQACLNWLISKSYVSGSRIAVVGHDYGAMYGALLADSDPRVHTAVLATPDATWGPLVRQVLAGLHRQPRGALQGAVHHPPAGTARLAAGQPRTIPVGRAGHLRQRQRAQAVRRCRAAGTGRLLPPL